jgi:hypothetical protein
VCYVLRMTDVVEKPSAAEVAELRKLRLEAMNLQAIEGNPLDAEDLAMFEMFEREGWSDEQCRAYILSRTPASHLR